MPSPPIGPEPCPHVVLELMHRLKVRDAMSSPVVLAAPGDSLRSIQGLMRDRGITGVPVAEEGRPVGMVSIGDVIEALDAGRIEESAASRMTRTVVSLEEGMPLALATSYFGRYSFGRFPVIDRGGLLVGVLTSADIVRALLAALNREVESLEEGLAAADPPSAPPESRVSLSFQVTRSDYEGAGKVSSEIKANLRRLGIDAAVVRRAAVASYELEINQVIHSEGGSIVCSAGGGSIEIVAEDRGPGIPDIEAAMRKGFSTADERIHSLGFGAGMGLSNAKQVSDEFEIESGAGRGTRVRCRFSY